MFQNTSTKKQLVAGSITALLASVSYADTLPTEKSLSTLKWDLIGKDELYDYKALSSYSEAPYLSKLVNAGKLPPVKDRLPKEPLVFKTAAMSDGIGVYGGVFRHVIGGRPEGWNWLGGLHQGWGGINITLQECLVRKGPLWQVKSEEQDGPLPNLAKSWTWSADHKTLSMQLIEGAKWSDGDPFDTDDISFWWDDNVQDTNVPSRMDKNGMGVGTVLNVTGDYTFDFVFQDPQGPARVDSLAYIQGCPGPSHVLKDHHPKYSDKSYDDYVNALPADGDGNGNVNVPVMGMFTPILHKADEIVVLRRNPYYWKVDEDGNQLPYYNEMHFKLSTWSDRTTQTVAGTGDFSNMENPGNYVEALKQSQSANSPTTVNFGPRVLGWDIEPNLSQTVGVLNDTDRELRGLFRQLEFRKALSHSLDRDAIGQSIVRGPFTHPWAGGFTSGSPFYNSDLITYFGYNAKEAKYLLAKLGLKDTNNDGILNLPNTGAEAEIDLWYDSSEATDKKQVDAVISQLAEVGLKLIAKPIEDIDTLINSGGFNLALRRNHWLVPTRETSSHLPISDNGPGMHLTGSDGRNLLQFEKDMVAAYNNLASSFDQQQVVANANEILRLWTKNVYTIGLVQAPAALLVNKRVKNAHPGVPVFMFEWAEDSLLRERLWTPANKQLDELLPNVVPHM